MQSTQRQVTQALLSANLNEQAHLLARELAMAFRKVSIYGESHPLALRSLEKPYLLCRQFFRFRKFVSINVLRGNLYIANIALKDSVFNAQILQYLQMLDMKAILFDETLTNDEFLFFVSTMVKRESLYDAGFSMSATLKQKGITSVIVNSEQAFDLFENRKQYRGDVDGDFSAKRMALDLMGATINQLARLTGARAEQLLALGIDFHPDIISYLLPERVVALPWTDIRASLVELAREIQDGGSRTSSAVDQYMGVFHLIDFHPERARIISDLSLPPTIEKRRKSSEDFGTDTGRIRIESTRRIDELLNKLFSFATVSEPVDFGVFAEFTEAFSRLLKTGQSQRAVEILVELIDRLSDPQAFVRQKALDALTGVIGEFNLLTDAAVLDTAVQSVIARISGRKESYEYSELIRALADKCMAGKRYDYLARLLVTLGFRRGVQGGVNVYDSMAVKKSFENVNQPEIISALIDDLLKARSEDVGHLKTILIAIGSQEIALALSEIISHPARQVRQLALKILAELGKNSLKVFSDMLVDDAWFERDKGRHELPDTKWYVIRNTIFVIGSLRDAEGVTPLRLRIADPDVRVRREIISALEKIGGEDAMDLLIIMAEDQDKEIRDAALGAISMIGTPEYAPMVIDLIRRNPSDAPRSMAALGKIGGSEAVGFLGRLMENEEAFNQLAAGKVSREDLRVALVRALGSLGDADSISRIRAYQNALSAAQKLLFRGSTVQKAISEVLSRY
ncbi:MAG: HEAT repeat domain-containing protein [candidate division Zixibacteria bacterium]|nr:HEAT repeat domain-containing protein [candidate division Zixibacteria bacterium]